MLYYCVANARNFHYNGTMKKETFRTLEVNARLRYLADIRGVPKDTIAVVEQTDKADDGAGNRAQGLCRIRVLNVPKGSRKMPFMDHLLAIFESEADLFEQVQES